MIKIRTQFHLSLITTVSCSVPAATSDSSTADPDGYTLIWSDEFETDGRPDPTNWTYEQGFTRNVICGFIKKTKIRNHARSILS